VVKHHSFETALGLGGRLLCLTATAGRFPAV
jgi:hypothetical protein